MPEPFLGILRVNSTFERRAGDVAVKESWNIPVKVIDMPTSSVAEVVGTSNNYSEAFIQGWIDVAQQMIDEGAVAITTSCGFLSALHPILQAKFPKIPIGTSSLLQISIASNLIEPGKRIGVLTFDGDVLGEKHLRAVGADPTTPIVGIEKGCSFDKLIRLSEPFDHEEHTKDLLKAAEKLITTYDDIGGIVLECANMPPFRRAIHEFTGLPVWDVVTLGHFVYEVGLSRAFPDIVKKPHELP